MKGGLFGGKARVTIEFWRGKFDRDHQYSKVVAVLSPGVAFVPCATLMILVIGVLFDVLSLISY